MTKLSPRVWCTTFLGHSVVIGCDVRQRSSVRRCNFGLGVMNDDADDDNKCIMIVD